MMRLNGHNHCLYALLPGDEQETWTKEQLEQMNARFIAALERAFELGLESRASARRDVKLPESPGPRWAIPLSSAVRDGLLRSAASGFVFVAR